MEDRIEKVKQYYDENSLKEWERLEQHPLEFIFTTYQMDRYIRQGDRILDIGGGPGRYSIYYAQKGCQVTLVDLSEGNIALAQQKAKEAGVSLSMKSKNCLELEELNLGQFDHVFLMGPLYHLPREDDRIQAVQIALNHLKPGGLFYGSFILEFSGLIYDLKNGPGFLPQDMSNPDMAKIIDDMIQGRIYTGPSFTSTCFFHPSKIRPFLQPFGLEELHLFGQEGILALNEYQVLSFPEEEKNLWIETAKKLLDVPEFLSLSEHAMYIGRKC